MPKPYREMDLLTFRRRFGTEMACRKRLFELRWPEGYRCPRCGFASHIFSKNARCISELTANIKLRSPPARSCTAPARRS